MEYVIGFIFGYFLKDFSFYLKRIANYQSPDKKEWDWITFQEDDLP
jgi:hypothetical protein|tara:strand:+ start:212 stop:349 length:138 start_codon:yes stop_codon:yes gene_type:complete